MPIFLLVDVDGNDLGDFRTSEHNWAAGDLIPRGRGNLRVLEVIVPNLPVDERDPDESILVVEPVE